MKLPYTKLALFSISLLLSSMAQAQAQAQTSTANHPFARTHWDPAYFDIASGTKPDQIDQLLSEAIQNTPHIFARINNPTPRMQRSLLAVLHDSARRNDGHAAEWAALLINAYASRYVQEVLPGLRAEITGSLGMAPADRVRSLLVFLANMAAPFDVIELN